MPLAVRLQDIEVVAVFANGHSGKEMAIRCSFQFELPDPIVWFIAGIELIVVLEISYDVLWRIRAKHLRHAVFRPVLVNFGMTRAT